MLLSSGSVSVSSSNTVQYIGCNRGITSESIRHVAMFQAPISCHSEIFLLYFCSMKQKQERKIIQQSMKWGAQTQPHVYCSLMLYPCCTLYETVFKTDTDTLPLLQGTEVARTKFKMASSAWLRHSHIINPL